MLKLFPQNAGEYGTKIIVDANSTRCSQAVTHLSTNHAQCCLTAVIRREPVFSTWHGRWPRMRYISKHRILHRPFRMKIQRFKSTCPGIK